MRKMIMMAALLLSACSATEQDYIKQPTQYGLYVAVINIYSEQTIQIRSDETGEVIAVQIHLYGTPGAYGYLEKSLKPGRYHLYDYKPFANVTISLLTDTGYFDVQADCFNYGGHIELGTHDRHAAYSDSVDLTELSGLPGPLAKQATSGKDVCMAPMGKPNQRFSYQAIKSAVAP
jgi:hypothetical protein